MDPVRWTGKTSEPSMNEGKFQRKRSGPESFDPTFSPPAVTGDTAFFRKPKMAVGRARKKDIPEGLWTKCPKCASMIFDRELDENLRFVPGVSIISRSVLESAFMPW